MFLLSFAFFIFFVFFFFNDTATTEIYTLSLHDALPILATETAGHPGSMAGITGHAAVGMRQVIFMGGYGPPALSALYYRLCESGFFVVVRAPRCDGVQHLNHFPCP